VGARTAQHVLGDGSSSRLFLNVREAAGLAYDVHSFQSDYADCGTLQVYAGVDPADQVRR
jgi:predicted Zn-dependent peptidase